MSTSNYKAKFKAGDKVRIIGNCNGHLAQTGEIVTLESIDEAYVNTPKTKDRGMPWNTFEYGPNTTFREVDMEPVKKEKEEETYQVDEAFIKKAYEAAPEKWRIKLAEKFPELFTGLLDFNKEFKSELVITTHAVDNLLFIGRGLAPDPTLVDKCLMVNSKYEAELKRDEITGYQYITFTKKKD